MRREPQFKAPKSGWTLTMGGGSRTWEDVVKAQQKAAEKYAKKFDNPKPKPFDCA